MKKGTSAPLSKVISRGAFGSQLDFWRQMKEMKLTSSNLRNQLNLMTEYGWNQNLEAELTYEHYLHDYLSIFGGINVENENDDSLDKVIATAIIGIRYFTPYMFTFDMRLDSKLRPQIGLTREIMIFPRTVLKGRIEYQADFGIVDNLPVGIDYGDD